MMHTIPSRSPGPIPSRGAAAGRSWSFRQAMATVNAAMLPPMAVWESPSSPAVITARESMTSSPARTQVNGFLAERNRDDGAYEELVHCVVVEALGEPGLLLHGGWAAPGEGCEHLLRVLANACEFVFRQAR